MAIKHAAAGGCARGECQDANEYQGGTQGPEPGWKTSTSLIWAHNLSPFLLLHNRSKGSQKPPPSFWKVKLMLFTWNY
jgi:hypothetical protein